MAEPGERVAVFLPSLEGGGGERTAALLAGALARRGWDVDLVLGRATGPFLVSVDQRVRVVDLGAKRFVLSLPRLMRYLRRERPRAMVSHVAVADFVHLVARRLTGIPRQSVVSVANDLYFGDVRIRLPQVRLAVRLLPHMYRWATRLVAVSHGVAASVVRASRLPESAVTVIYNPIIDDGLLAARHAPLDHPWFVQGAPPVLLGVGRLAGQKDF